MVAGTAVTVLPIDVGFNETVTVKEQLELLPAASVPEYETVVAPSGKVLPLEKPAVNTGVIQLFLRIKFPDEPAPISFHKPDDNTCT